MLQREREGLVDVGPPAVPVGYRYEQILQDKGTEVLQVLRKRVEVDFDAVVRSEPLVSGNQPLLDL